MKCTVYSNMMNDKEFYIPNHPKCSFTEIIKIHLEDKTKDCFCGRYELFENGNEMNPNAKIYSIIMKMANDFVSNR